MLSEKLHDNEVYKVKDLIDRTREVKYIVEDINQSSKRNENKLLFIWADSGIGKSTTIKKASLQKNLLRKIIYIDTPPINTNNIVENGMFIRIIADRLNSIYEDVGWGLKNFLVQGMSDTQRKKELSKVLVNLPSLPSTVFSLLCEKLLQMCNDDVEEIINDINVESLLICVEYIKFIINIYDIVIDITNIQNIDPSSVNELRKLFIKEKNLYFIFEYTTINNNTTDLWRIVNSFEEVVSVKVLKLQLLPIEYALTILETNTIKDIDTIERFYNNIAKGNLYKLLNAKEEFNSNISCNFLDDPIAIRIKHLNYSQKIILGIVCLCDGSLSVSEYESIINFISNDFYINQNEIFSLAGLVEVNDTNYICVSHASVIDTFDVSNENYAALISYKFLSDYYEKKSLIADFNISDKNHYLLKLLKLYSIFDPIKILEKIPEFRKFLITSLSEENAAEIINKIYYAISDDMADGFKVKLQIINIAYESGFYHTAFSLLSELKSNDSKIILFKAMLLNRLDKHTEVISLCNEYLKKRPDLRTEFIIKMIRMLSERSLNDEKAYQKTFNSLFKNPTYTNIDEYGYLLRNSQIVFSFSESIKYINESIDFFNKRKKYKDMACSQLTLAVQKARLGKTEEAKNIIKYIEPILLNTTFEKHIIYMDKAAISLLDCSANDETLLLLEKSYLTATTNFDKVVILNNQLCWYILNKTDKRLFFKLKSQLDNLLLLEPDLRLHKRTLINYNNYYRHVLGDINTANEVLKKASTIIIPNDTVANAFISNTCSDNNIAFLTSHKYYVSFITYWHFDLPMI